MLQEPLRREYQSIRSKPSRKVRVEIVNPSLKTYSSLFKKLSAITLMSQPLLASLFDETERRRSLCRVTTQIRAAGKAIHVVWVEARFQIFARTSSGHGTSL